MVECQVLILRRANIDSTTNVMQTQSLPCETCRRRKVKCSKTEPCSNCRRAGIECVYASEDRSQTRTTSTISNMAQRITRLEETVEQLKHQLSSVLHSSAYETCTTKLDSSGEKPQGNLISLSDRSRYIKPSFWASTYSNVSPAPAADRT